MPERNEQQAQAKNPELLDLLQTERRLKDFRELFDSPQDLAALADRAEIREYQLAGHKITQQGQSGEEFFIVIDGQLRAIDIRHQPNPRLLTYLTHGDIFGTPTFLESHQYTATVETVTPIKLAVFNGEDWRWLLNKNPSFRDYFRRIETYRANQAKVDFPGKQSDEVVIMSTKRHFVAFLARLPLPLGLLIAPVLFFLIAEIFGLEFWSIAFGTLPLLLTMPFIITALLLIVYHYLDWRNDDLIVTTKRVTHIERILFYGEQRRDAPLSRVQDVTTVSDIFDYIFDSDSLIITTAGAGEINIDHIRRADEVREAILEQRDYALARVEEADLTSLQKIIAHRIGAQDKLPENIIPVAEPDWSEDSSQPTSHHTSSLVDYFIPRVKEVDTSGEITWRKHRFVLLANILKPTAALIVLFYLFLFPMWAAFQALIGIGIAACLFWYLWEYDDWYRDLYKVTDTQISDIDSAAFRLRKTRRDGSFDKIENIYAEVPNLFYKLLNMGNVIIETAGSEDTFTFKKVYNPSAVHREIFSRWAQYQRRQREQQRVQTNQQIMEILTEYHRLNSLTERQR